MKKTLLTLFTALMLFTLGCAGAPVSAPVNMSFDELNALLEHHTLVVAYEDGTVITYTDRGIQPLFAHIDNFGGFENTFVFDRVTGKGSALLLAYGNATRLHTGVLSQEAIPVLESHNIEFSADIITYYIANRAGTGRCLIEQTIAEIDDPVQAHAILRERFSAPPPPQYWPCGTPKS
ncbi:MAG: DUF1893 domain-containing protein [Elusimicrobia bacterium]|nr:DUF1893 domain-containing protein [Elusimicrobiota bacterium]